jgi:site-specific DNA-methyltransferase (adenine-specific)
MTISKALYSSKKEDWRTPKEVLDVVREMGPIDLDPCASPNKRHWFAKDNWTDEGLLATRDLPKGLIFVNPPYGSNIIDWVTKWTEGISLSHRSSILLLPSRTDTRWFHETWKSIAAYCFWEGRIKFVGAPHPAPFPSVLFYAGANPHRFCDVFQKKGIVGLI